MIVKLLYPDDNSNTFDERSRDMTKEDLLRILAGSFDDACKGVDAAISGPYIVRFKIGKSGDDPDERKKKYEDEGYTGFITVYESSNKALIDILEKLLITKYKREHPFLCENKQVGGGDISGGNTPYIYVAVEDALIAAVRKYFYK